MKILFLSRYQDTIQRGAETFVRELSSELKLSHEIEILTGKKADSLGEIIKRKPQIVVSVNGGWQTLKASIGRIIGGYKLVVTGQAGIGRGEIFNIVFAKPDLYVALTKNMFDWVKKWAWGSKVVKIYNGVDLDKFKPEGQKFDFDLTRPVILSVGALVWYKHHEKTIRAVSLLSKGSLVLIGKGPKKEELEKLGKSLLGNRFKIIESDYESLPKIYRSADLFVLPSWDREAFGIVYLEAMASGLGVVAPFDLSRLEIIGDAGILTDVSDPKSYAQALDQALKEDWRDKALDQAKGFSWKKIAKDYEETFEEII